MPSPDEPDQPPTAAVGFRLVPDFASAPAAYANFAQASYTPHDLTLYFGQYAVPVFSEPPQGEVEVPVKPLIAITVPLNIVPGLVSVLQAQMDNYEQNFGQAYPRTPGDQQQQGGDK